VIILTDPKLPFDKNDVFKHCKGKIAFYKIPKFIKVVESYPVTISGKP